MEVGFGAMLSSRRNRSFAQELVLSEQQNFQLVAKKLWLQQSYFIAGGINLCMGRTKSRKPANGCAPFVNRAPDACALEILYDKKTRRFASASHVSSLQDCHLLWASRISSWYFTVTYGVRAIMQHGILDCNFLSTARKETQAKQVSYCYQTYIYHRSTCFLFFFRVYVVPCHLKYPYSVGLTSHHVLAQCKQEIGTLNWGDRRHNNITQFWCFMSQTTVRLSNVYHLVQGHFYHVGFLHIDSTQCNNLQPFSPIKMQKNQQPPGSYLTRCPE